MLFTYEREQNTEKFYCFVYKSNEESTVDKYMVEKIKLEKEPNENIRYELISDTPGHKKIVEILGGNYKIPTYQRGYRWDSKNVIKLLEDIYEGKLLENIDQEKTNSIKSSNNFNSLKTHIARRNEITDNWDIKENYKYCIQPLVVMRKGRMNEYDVVDGQQRLTTIAVILSALKFCCGIYSSNSFEDSRISLSYDARPGSKEFLDFIWDFKGEKKAEEIIHLIESNEFRKYIWETFQKDNEFDKNIDFEHILNSFQITVKFILQKVETFKDVFGDNNVFHYCDYLYFVLINCTEVIWYIADKENEEKDNIDERKIFANFNTGKLPLSNAELIKAIFMNPSNYGIKDNGATIKDRQIVIAEKWDAIETELHNPDFWTFVPHGNQYNNSKQVNDTRIDVIFDFLVMRNWLKDCKSVNYKENVDRYINVHKNDFLDKYYTFNEIEKWINCKLQSAVSSDAKREVMDKCWNEVRDIFSSLKEFYNDDGRNPKTSSKLYNLIGFYIYANNTLRKDGTFYTSYKNNGVINNIGQEVYLRVYGFLYELSKKPRTKRENFVKDEIKKLLGLDSNIREYINSLSYEKNNEIAILLLLYNIALLNKSGGIGNRFNFSEYAKQTWQREHIFAQDEDYLKENRLAERKAALNSLAKGFDNEDKEAGLKENSFLQYINFKHNYELNYCPIKNNDEEGNHIPIDDFAIKEFRNRYERSTGYNKEYADAIKAAEQAKNLLNMYNWFDEAKRIRDEFDNYKTNKNKRLKEGLVDDILRYLEDNTRFLRYIVIDSLDFIDDDIEYFLKKEEDIYKFDINRFNQYILEKLQIDLNSMRNNPLADFRSYSLDMDTAKVEFKVWLNESIEGEKDKRLDTVNKIIKERYARKLKEIFWFKIDDKNKIFDMCDSGENFESIKEAHLELKNREKNNRNDVDDINDNEITEIDNEYPVEEFKSDVIIDNTAISSKEEKLENLNDIEEIKGKYRIEDDNIDFVMISINSHIKNISKMIDEFFEKDYTKFLNDNSIGNLTLLFGSVNSSIKNKSYSEKCKDVYKEFKNGSFIPLSTILVFTDLYTKGLNSATQWLPESRLAYLDDLIKTIEYFLEV